MKRKSPTKLDRAKCFVENNGQCHICKRKIAPGEPWHMEHPRALWAGGENVWKPAHIDCHAGKTKREAKSRAKADRNMKHTAGITRPKQKIRSRGFAPYVPNVKQLVEDWKP